MGAPHVVDKFSPTARALAEAAASERLEYLDAMDGNVDGKVDIDALLDSRLFQIPTIFTMDGATKSICEDVFLIDNGDGIANQGDIVIWFPPEHLAVASENPVLMARLFDPLDLVPGKHTARGLFYNEGELCVDIDKHFNGQPPVCVDERGCFFPTEFNGFIETIEDWAQDSAAAGAGYRNEGVPYAKIFEKDSPGKMCSGAVKIYEYGHYISGTATGFW